MSARTSSCFLVVSLALAHLSWSTRAEAQPCAGVTLPAQLEAFGSTLKQNGVGLREATVLDVDVYVAGLYLERPSKDVAAVLDKHTAKLILLQFVRDVSRDEMVNAIHEALKNNVGASFGMMQAHMSTFMDKLPEFRKGTRLSIAYRPSHGVELRVDGKPLGMDKDDTFGNLIFQAWLGKHPPDADLKQGLLGGDRCQ